MPRIGYARGSSSGDPVSTQLEALSGAGCARTYLDVADGSKQPRPQWDQCVARLRRGDVLIVYRADRIGASLRDLAEITHDLYERGVALRSLTEPCVDTTGTHARLVLTLLEITAEYNTAMVRERTRPGLQAVPLRGRPGGRKPKMTPEKISMAQRMYDSGQYSVSQIADKCGVTRETVYRYIDTKHSRKQGAILAHESLRDARQ